jgi:iron complex outermembrane receptor protein
MSFAADIQVASADVSALSIEQLSAVEITSVSKAAEPLSGAAAAVYVISHDDAVNSGATSLGDLLRLAPNLEVMQTSPAAFQITARGFNGNAADQNFPNKLLVLIDGRSVYSPLYSGVYWDMQPVMAENIERIEVISGPGGTLWGANAVNGVVNVVTRDAADTKGGFVQFEGGDQYASAALQYGGALSGDADYRIYATDFYQRAFAKAGGGSAGDGWSRPAGGFRLDWHPGEEKLTLGADIYGGSQSQPGAINQRISGGNLTLRWRHPLADGDEFQLLSYFDQARRSSRDGGAFTLNTYDIELQHNFTLGGWNRIVWGVGERLSQYRITGRIAPDNSLLFVPPARTLSLANIFAEDRIALGEDVQLSLGLKLENEPYSGLEPMPSALLSWQMDSSDLLWTSVSRVVRSPTPFDTDVLERSGTIDFIAGNPDFKPEEVIAFEAGYRGQFGPDLSVSVSAFENLYHDLRSIEPKPVTILPLLWGNGIRGAVHGVEIWGSYQAASWWRLSAGLTVQHLDLEFAPGASGFLGLAQAGDDPHHYAQLRSTMALSDDVTFEADFREVGALPDPKVPGYAELNARLAWHLSPTLDLAVAGFNLLHGSHVEYAGGDAIRRSVLVQTQWRF